MGGTVHLKAIDASGNPLAFNFGSTGETGGFVSLRQSVTLAGETVGGAMTTITGGFLPVRARSPVSSKVSGIHFDTPGYIAVVVNTSTGIHISGNRITHVQGFGVSEGMESFGVFMSGMQSITGKVVVENNVIDGFVSDYAIGIGSVFIQSAVVYAIGNEIRGAHTGGIISTQSARVVIERNYIEPGPTTNPDSPGNGIWIAGPVSGARASIRANTVVCVNPQADGILISASAHPASALSHIAENDVTMSGSKFAAISLVGRVSNVFVTDNRLSGSGTYAMQIAAAAGQSAEANTISGNDNSEFMSAEADVFLDVGTQGNLLSGTGTVIDLGTGNKIHGFTPI
jgi:hypothetical protein